MRRVSTDHWLITDFMGFIGGTLGYEWLRRFHPLGQENGDTKDGGSYQAAKDKLTTMLGPEIWDAVQGRTVLDFGCGTGRESVALAQSGARRVIGLEILPRLIAEAEHYATKQGVADKCTFATQTNEKADVIISLDAFEHFAEPADMLGLMRRLVRDNGTIWAAFGPTWYHPLGGHLFSVFPWAHLVFTEKALLRWRADRYHDGATRFHEVEGGLNRLTIRRFEQIVAASDFRCEELTPVPIRRLRPFANALTREFVTSFVRCRLVPR